MYFVTAPKWMRLFYPGLTWEIPVEPGEKIIYLTFDDGPHAIATPFVLDQLKKYEARASFFCIGRNVADHPDLYQRILDEGHTTGNHTHQHLNGWKVTDQEYIADVLKAAERIDSRLFRPPYGRISRFQSAVLRQQLTGYPLAGAAEGDAAGARKIRQAFSIIMWSVLSADWDEKIDGERCYKNVVRHTKPGSIIVFHDSARALPRLEYALPKVLAYFSSRGYRFQPIPAPR